MARILEAAQHLFIEKGFNATRTDEIGSAAGLTKGAVYFYFGEKTAVLLALLKRVQARVLEPLIERLSNEQSTPQEKVRDFLMQQAKLATDEPAMLLLPIMVSLEFAGTDEEPGRRIRWGYRQTTLLLAQVIKEGQAQGLFRRDLLPEQQASMILALNDGAMLEWWRSHPRKTGRGLVDAVYAVLMSGIRSAEPTPRRGLASDKRSQTTTKGH